MLRLREIERMLPKLYLTRKISFWCNRFVPLSDRLDCRKTPVQTIVGRTVRLKEAIFFFRVGKYSRRLILSVGQPATCIFKRLFHREPGISPQVSSAELPLEVISAPRYARGAP